MSSIDDADHICPEGYWIEDGQKFKSKKDNLQHSDELCRTLLRAMTVKLDDMDKAYLSEYYDEGIALINTGGLTCINGHFFLWAKRAMALVRQKFTVDTLDIDPIHGFKQAKRLVLEDQSLKNLFLARVRVCFSELGAKPGDENQTKVRMVPKEEVLATAERIYEPLLQKVFHARSAEEFIKWKKKRVVAKKKLPFRFGLKAKECEKSSGSKKKESKKSNTKKNMVVESATKAPKAKKVCLTTDKKAPKPKVAKVTPPKLDVPTGVGVQLKRPPECLDDSSGKKARTEIDE